MSALTKFFFRAPYAAPKTSEIFRWWEARRLAYNLAVGAAGIMSLSAMYVLGAVLNDDVGQIPFIAIAVYGVLANLCYFLGPVADTWIMKKWGRQYSEVGPTLFRYGFAFSVALTLLPVPVIAFRLILEVFFRLF
jgi:hypothetical protein